VAGTTTVYVTGSNFASGLTTSNVTVSFASTCGGAAIPTDLPSSVTVPMPTEDRIGVLIPKALSLTGNYYISVDASGVPSVELLGINRDRTSHSLRRLPAQQFDWRWHHVDWTWRDADGVYA
jgi:hypothetical protein